MAASLTQQEMSQPLVWCHVLSKNMVISVYAWVCLCNWLSGFRFSRLLHLAFLHLFLKLAAFARMYVCIS